MTNERDINQIHLQRNLLGIFECEFEGFESSRHKLLKNAFEIDEKYIFIVRLQFPGFLFSNESPFI